MEDSSPKDIKLYAEEYLIAPPDKFSLNLKELWAYRELFYYFTWRDIKVKYKQTVLGFLWVILQPVLMMLLFTVIFGNALKVNSDGIPYPVFVYSGLLLWGVFSSGLSNASNSMVSHANIIKKIYFPRLVIPMSSILAALFDFFVAFLVYIVILIIFQQPVDLLRILIFLPASILLTVITTFGLGCLFAAFNVKYRDFRYIVPFLLQFLLFVNPVIYSTSIFKAEWMQYLIAFNPMAGAINMSRFAFLDSPIRWDLLAISVASAFLWFFIGIYVFRKMEAYFADIA